MKSIPHTFIFILFIIRNAIVRRLRFFVCRRIMCYYSKYTFICII